tara:strand:+ start:366 stop:1151 length:786 start_codon:yes stop_codon:yes gene_type:complete
MNRKFIYQLTTTILLTFLAPLVLAQNIAIVNGKPIPQSRVEGLIKQISKSGQQITPEIQMQVKEELIAREIFIQEAQKNGLDKKEEFQMQIELARQTLLIRELFNDYQLSHPVTPADIKAEYDKFTASSSGKEYKARHILVEQEDEAKKIITQLQKGAKFEDIAKKISKDTGSGANGGDLGWAPPSSYVSEFSEAMVKLAKGKITTIPIKSQFGYHIIKLEDTRDTELPSLDTVKSEIQKQLEQQRLNQYQQEVRSKAKVE